VECWSSEALECWIDDVVDMQPSLCAPLHHSIYPYNHDKSVHAYIVPEVKMELQFGLNLGGWIFILIAWGSIIGLTIFCFKRVLVTHNDKK